MNESDLLLGKTTEYVSEYTPSLLQGIAREQSRIALGIDGQLPFDGVDIWTGYELSWLNERGKPQVATANFYVPCHSVNIVESKSFKLYLNSLNQTKFSDVAQLTATLESDLKAVVGRSVVVEVQLLGSDRVVITRPVAENIDGQDITINQYSPDSSLLHCRPGGVVEEVLSSDLLKTNCPVTGQPDWASVFIRYRGNAIERESLLRYIVSFRQHQDFHEHCVETMFQDISQQCKPEALLVYARYTRRGGLDINPLRCSHGYAYNAHDIAGRLLRQ